MTATVRRVVLDGDLTVQVAEQVKDQLLAELDGVQRVELDLAAVTELDTAGLQVLLVAAREAQAQGKRLELDGISGPVAQVLALARLGTGLGVPAQELW